MTKGIHQKIIFENEDDMNFFIDSKLVQKERAGFVNGCGIDVDDYKPVPKKRYFFGYDCENNEKQ